MKIKKIQRSQRRKERVLLIMEDESILKVTEQELLQFHLYIGMDLDPALVVQLQESTRSSNARAQAARIIGSRALSRKELTKRLDKRGVEEEEAAAAADWLEEIGALDDASYAAALVRHYSKMGYGPARLRQELQQRGIARELWEEALLQAPPAEDVIRPYIEKKLRGKAPEEKELKRLSDALQRRGFGWSEIRACLRQYTDHLDGEESDV